MILSHQAADAAVQIIAIERCNNHDLEVPTIVTERFKGCNVEGE